MACEALGLVPSTPPPLAEPALAVYLRVGESGVLQRLQIEPSREPRYLVAEGPNVEVVSKADNAYQWTDVVDTAMPALNISVQ